MAENNIKIYISSLSGNPEVKKRQQRVTMILDSKQIPYTVVDITEPSQEKEKEFMQTNSKCKGETVSDTDPRRPLPPQVFNGEAYCGDYNGLELANECDTLEAFLLLPTAAVSNGSKASNGSGVAAPEAPVTTSEAAPAAETEETPQTTETETNGAATEAPSADDSGSVAEAGGVAEGGDGGDAGGD